MRKEMGKLPQSRKKALRQQRQLCEEPWTEQAEEQQRAVAMLPEAATLDRLIRYETHADRSLHRALETLAKLRGATVETIAARVSGQTAEGASMELFGQRTSWRAAE